MVHTFSQHSGDRGRWISEFEASLVYKLSSKTARATQKNPVSRKKKKRKEGRKERMNLAVSYSPVGRHTVVHTCTNTYTPIILIIKYKNKTLSD